MQHADYKRCKACGEQKARSEFSRNANAADQLQGICKPCDYAQTKAWREKNREKRREQSRRGRAYRLEREPDAERKRIQKWRTENREVARERTRATLAVMRAVRRGVLVRPDLCSRCGAEAFIEAHHEDYSAVLDVIWLCRPCHRAADVERRNREHS